MVMRIRRQFGAAGRWCSETVERGIVDQGFDEDGVQDYLKRVMGIREAMIHHIQLMVKRLLLPCISPQPPSQTYQ